MKPLRVFTWLMLCWLNAAAMAVEVGTDTVRSGEVDIPVTRYGAPGKTLILWFPSEYGVLAAEHIAARHLAEKGYETWLPDIYGAHFLPVVPSSAEALAATDIYAVIRAARRTGKMVYLLSSGRGAKYTLEGARWWAQKAGPKQALAGAVLLHPNLYEKQPDPGEDPTYLPIASNTRLRIFIYQGDLSPWYWTLDSLQSALRKKGSTVSVEVLPDFRDRFFFREDAKPAERALGERLPELIVRAIVQLQTEPKRKTRSTQ